MQVTKPLSDIDNHLSQMEKNIQEKFGKKISNIIISLSEITIVSSSENLDYVAKTLRDDINFSFDTLVDLCGVDYLKYNSCDHDFRYAVVIHLLSTKLNHRMRLKVPCHDDNLPLIPSLTKIWPAA